MIDVRIRRSWDARAAHLADVCDVADLEPIRRSLIAWGIVDVDDPEESVAGQWVVESGQAYFEFIVMDEDES